MATLRRMYCWETECYIDQKKNWWPKQGKHILAQYDEDTVIVYQAYNPEIARYAVEHQKFGGEQFSFARMSWIKTNFLWMMYRCGWASKKNQERVLAVRITRQGFEEILARAYTVELQKSKKMNTKKIEVRLQWDPDHSPTYGKLKRRAIQLGLKDETLRQYGTEWVVEIKDITDFVKEQYQILQHQGRDHILTAKERVFTVTDPVVASQIEIDEYNTDSCQTDESEEDT